MYYVGFYCNWAGLEIHEEQLDSTTGKMTCKTKQPVSGHVEFRWEFKFLLQQSNLQVTCE